MTLGGALAAFWNPRVAFLGLFRGLKEASKRPQAGPKRVQKGLTNATPRHQESTRIPDDVGARSCRLLGASLKVFSNHINGPD